MLIQFSSVEADICAFGKAHLRSTPSLRGFPNVAFEMVPNVRRSDDGPLSSFQGRLSSASSFNASLLQTISGVMFLALCPQVVSQASQHFRSSEKQATSEDCFALQSVCSVESLHSGMLGSTPTGVLDCRCRPLTHSSLTFPFHFL